MTVRILQGDCREVLATLPADSVNCVVTSPPYWGLRDYGIGNDAFGLEPTYQLYVEHAVEVFRAVRRVLRPDGTLWLNLGDSYCSGGRATWRSGASENKGQDVLNDMPRPAQPTDLKPKDLIGIPWRVALALQADGWWLRQDIIWAKPNPMPESITDRCCKSHEYLFLLTKSARYYFDAEAIAEPASDNAHARTGKMKMPDGWDTGAGSHGSFHRDGREKGKTSWKGSKFDGPRDLAVRPDTGCNRAPGVTPKSAPEDSLVRAKESWHASTTEVLATRNKRSVWTVATAPFSEAHSATFPPALIKPCILAGCPEGGTVLDPFGGAGTTGLVADRLGRSAILIELNPAYAAMAQRRILGDAGMFGDVTVGHAGK